MPRSKTYHIILIFILIVAMQSCKINQPGQESALPDIPSAYKGSKDSISIEKFRYKDLFNDSSLISLINIALKNNQDVQIASQRIELARAGFKLHKGASLPSLSFESSAGIRRYADHTIDGVGNYDTNLSPNITEDQRIPSPTPDYFTGFRSSWELDVWGKMKNLKKASYSRFLASQKWQHFITTNLIADIAYNYYTLLALDTELEIIKKNIRLQESALETSRVLKEGGMANELAVSQMSAQLLNTQSLLVDTEQRIIETENKISILLGRLPEAIPRGSSIIDLKIPGRINVGIPSDLLRNRPDIMMAELELIASKADVKAARAAFLPSFTITGFGGLNAFSSSVLFSNPGSLAYGIMGGLSAPLFNRNILKANYRVATANQQQAFYTYQKSIVVGYTEVATSLAQLENLQRKDEIKRREVEALQKSVTISNDLFLAGYASYLEVINTQRNVLYSELDWTENKKEQFISLIHLYRFLGGGWN